LLVASVVCLLAISFGGCGKKSISKTELRAITDEIVAAAQRVAGHKVPVEIHPETETIQTGPLTTQHESDLIFIALPDTNQANALSDALDEIARRHKLAVEESSSNGVLRLSFSRAGVRTHSIHIITPLAARSRPSAGARPGVQNPNGPRLAIIIDDMGHDRAAADQLLALPFPLTISVLPNQPLSREVAEEAFHRGDQVLLHCPMEPEANSAGGPDGVTQEPVELRVGMNAADVNSTLTGMLETVPHAAGVNNHEGSRATADAALMQEFMPDLRARNLFFIDSRTSAATVAYSTAERDGVPAASRKVFLDDTPTKEAVLAQLDVATKDAQRDGSAIAIGHPRPATIAAITQALPALESHGIRLVFASDLVR
jgi:uncharacterized protein